MKRRKIGQKTIFIWFLRIKPWWRIFLIEEFYKLHPILKAFSIIFTLNFALLLLFLSLPLYYFCCFSLDIFLCTFPLFTKKFFALLIYANYQLYLIDLCFFCSFTFEFYFFSESIRAIPSCFYNLLFIEKYRMIRLITLCLRKFGLIERILLLLWLYYVAILNVKQFLNN